MEARHAPSTGQGISLGEAGHAAGACTLCAWWAICSHHLPETAGGFWLSSKRRGSVAASFLAILSGFFAGQEPQDVPPDAAARLGASRLAAQCFGVHGCHAVLTAWLATILGLLVVALGTKGPPLSLWPELQCVLLVQTWLPGHAECCPSCCETWLVASMIPCWFLAASARACASVPEFYGGNGLLKLSSLLWIMTGLPLLVLFWWHDRSFPHGLGTLVCRWPGFVLPDFLLGLAAATKAGRLRQLSHCRQVATDIDGGSSSASTDSASESSSLDTHKVMPPSAFASARIADASALTILAAVLFAPGAQHSTGSCADSDVLLARALAPLLALFLFCGACGHGDGEPTAGVAARLLRHRALANAGAFALEAFLLQGPVFDAFELAVEPQLKASAEGFFAAFLCVWLLAGLWSSWLSQGPLGLCQKSVMSIGIASPTPPPGESPVVRL